MKTMLFLLTFSVGATIFALDKDHKTYITKERDETMVYIPSGTFNMETMSTELSYREPEKPKVVSCDGFFISPYETSNQEYLEYLGYLKNSGNHEAYQAALPDTNVWRRPLAYNEPYVEYYLRHPAYWYYPVIGITHQQAVDYCTWLTTVYNEYPKRKYKHAVFRLPTKAEWYYAASIRPDKKEKKEPLGDKYPAQDLYELFPWDGTSMQNTDGTWKACFSPVEQYSVRSFEGTLTTATDTLQNRFLLAEKGGYSMSVPGSLNDGSDILAPVFSFGANSFGLYNMAGNAEEFVAEYGITKGGSWYDTGFYLRNDVEETYDSSNETSSMRGFRIVMNVVEEW
jgi:formylglycine-generating enzyme